MTNKGAYIQFDDQLQRKIHQFESVLMLFSFEIAT